MPQIIPSQGHVLSWSKKKVNDDVLSRLMKNKCHDTCEVLRKYLEHHRCSTNAIT